MERTGHVHFGADCEEGHSSSIVLQKVDEENVNAHVGFLQLNHRYDISLDIPCNGEKFTAISQPSLAIKNLHSEPSLSSDCVLLRLELFAHKQKLLKEKVLLGGNGKTLTVTVCARVLGCGQGTPMLRDGVKLLGTVSLEESEMSDWKGFD